MNRPAMVMLAVGLAVGWLLGMLTGSVRVGPPPTPAAPVAASRETRDDDATLRQELDQAMADNAELSEQLRTAQGGTTAADGGEFLIPRSLLKDLNLEVFRDGGVSPDLISFLHLNPGETTAVNHAIHEASSRLKQLQATHARLLAQTATETKVQIDAFADEGEQVRGELGAQVQGVLGADRGGIFMQKVTDLGGDEFANFGKDKVVVTLTSLPSGVMQCKADYGTSSMTVTGSSVPAQFAHLFDSDTEAKPASGNP